jgi:hypothetical protein
MTIKPTVTDRFLAIAGKKSNWGSKLFFATLIFVLIFFWWLLIYSGGVTVHHG